MTNDIYKAVLLAHYRDPKNQGSVEGANLMSEGFNANCGDKVRLGLFMDGDVIRRIVHQSRACAICTASISMMSEQLAGATVNSAKQCIAQIKLALTTNTHWPTGCEALSGAATSINRHKCILLGWQACEEALDQAQLHTR